MTHLSLWFLLDKKLELFCLYTLTPEKKKKIMNLAKDQEGEINGLWEDQLSII